MGYSGSNTYAQVSYRSANTNLQNSLADLLDWLVEAMKMASNLHVCHHHSGKRQRHQTGFGNKFDLHVDLLPCYIICAGSQDEDS